MKASSHYSMFSKVPCVCMYSFPLCIMLSAEEAISPTNVAVKSTLAFATDQWGMRKIKTTIMMLCCLISEPSWSTSFCLCLNQSSFN